MHRRGRESYSHILRQAQYRIKFDVHPDRRRLREQLLQQVYAAQGAEGDSTERRSQVVVQPEACESNRGRVSSEREREERSPSCPAVSAASADNGARGRVYGM